MAILADDLTGALDTAAPFAVEGASIRIAWRAEDDDDAAPMAFDTESRQVNARTAEGRVRTALPWLRAAGTSFKKLDSLLRGNTLAELVVCARHGDFPRVVVAPAFPEQGRITRRGVQIVPEAAGAPPLAVDLAAVLAGHGVPVRIVPRGEELPRRGVAICDAETPADLAHIAAAGRSADGSATLWCGSGGLARAMGRPEGARPRALPAPLLAVVGSRHPVAVAQVHRLREASGIAVAVVRGDGDVPGVVDAVSRRLTDGHPAAIVFALTLPDPAAAAATMARTFAALSRTAPPAGLAVVGGDTLFRLCRSLDAESLVATGEWAPGIPVARIVGGRWDGVRLVTKSGAFGDPDVLVRLLETATETPCA